MDAHHPHYGDLNEMRRTYLPPVIGLYSSGPQSGKTSVAKHLQERYGYTPVKFAGPLKAMLRALLASAGYGPDVIEECIEGEMKEEILGDFKTSPRRLMQTLGHEWGRCQVRSDLWVDLFKDQVQRILVSGGLVVCDDMRYANEAACIRSFEGSKLWRIITPHRGPFPKHPSEGGLDSFLFDESFWNTKSLPALLSQITTTLEGPIRGTGLSE